MGSNSDHDWFNSKFFLRSQGDLACAEELCMCTEQFSALGRELAALLTEVKDIWGKPKSTCHQTCTACPTIV